MKQRNSRPEQGSALLISMIMLAFVGLIGLASLQAVSMNRQSAGFQAGGRLALYAAEAGIERAMRTLADSDLPTGLAALEDFTLAVPGENLGDPGDHPSGQPRFATDPDAPAAIDYLGVGNVCEEWDMSIEVGGPIYLYSVWDVRMQGTTPIGAEARVQASATRCHAYSG